MSELYFFPKSNLLCESSDELNFHVINGGWSFELHGDEAMVDGKILCITGEYEEHTRNSFDKCYTGFGY